MSVSQNDIAKAAGVSQRAVSGGIRGHSTLSALISHGAPFPRIIWPLLWSDKHIRKIPHNCLICLLSLTNILRIQFYVYSLDESNERLAE